MGTKEDDREHSDNCAEAFEATFVDIKNNNIPWLLEAIEDMEKDEVIYQCEKIIAQMGKVQQ